jgi:hypothetical protein
MDPNEEPQNDKVSQTEVPIQVPIPVAMPHTDVPLESTDPPAFAPIPPYQPAIEDNPGRMLGIVGMIFLIVGLGLVGLILGIVGFSKSKKVSKSNGFAIAAIIVGIVNIVVFCLIALVTIVAYNGITSKANAASLCSQQQNVGTVVVGDKTYMCGTANTSN